MCAGNGTVMWPHFWSEIQVRLSVGQGRSIFLWCLMLKTWENLLKKQNVKISYYTPKFCKNILTCWKGSNTREDPRSLHFSSFEVNHFCLGYNRASFSATCWWRSGIWSQPVLYLISKGLRRDWPTRACSCVQTARRTGKGHRKRGHHASEQCTRFRLLTTWEVKNAVPRGTSGSSSRFLPRIPHKGDIIARSYSSKCLQLNYSVGGETLHFSFHLPCCFHFFFFIFKLWLSKNLISY